MSQVLKSKLCPSINDSLIHCPAINCMAMDGQVCFHRWLFAYPVKPCWCITGPVGPLGSTNLNWLCVRLLPMAVSVYLAVCVHSCRLLGIQHYCLWLNGREGPHSACPPTPTTPYHPSTLL